MFLTIVLKSILSDHSLFSSFSSSLLSTVIALTSSLFSVPTVVAKKNPVRPALRSLGRLCHTLTPGPVLGSLDDVTEFLLPSNNTSSFK